MKRFILTGLVIVAIILAFDYYSNPLADVDVPLTSLQEQPDVFQLDNGMLVTIKEAHALPLVTIQFWVHAGARNEWDERRGIAHVFEHIWFKGTETQPVGSFHKRVESLGGELNAMTSHDWTMYFVTVPSDRFDDIFPYMVDLLRNPLFDQHEISKELEVIVEEQRFSFNEPERHLDDQFGLLLIDNHPYRNPVIGYKETILSVTREDLIHFYNTWYVPNNMNVVIVGDIDKNDAVRKVAGAFGDIPPKPLPPLSLPGEAPILIPKFGSGLKDVGYNYVAIGFVGPSASEKDKYAMMVLNSIFSAGESSRLQRIVKQDKNLIVRGTSVFIPLNDMGVFEAVTVVEPERAGEAKAELILQLGRFRNEYVADEELERAKMNIRAGKVKSQEEMFQVGFDIGQAWIDGDLSDYHNFLSHINAVTKEDVRRVANAYFSAYTMYEVKPRI